MKPKAIKKAKPRVSVIALRQEISALRFIGAQMANLCFNLGRRSPNDPLSQQNLDAMRELAYQWDEIKRA